MVPKIEFFKRAVDEEPFHVKYYKKDEDPDLCGDVELPLCYNPGQTCAECHGAFLPEIRSGWNAIYLIKGFMKNILSFIFFFEVLFQNNFN